MKRISEKSGQDSKIMLKLVPKSKTSKSLKLLLADKKANSSILMRLEMAGMAQNIQKCLFSLWSLK